MIKGILHEWRGSRLAAVLALCLAPLMASADFTKTNPVTGETENYTWKFVGTDTWNGSQYWQNSDGDNPSDGGVPAKTSGGNIWDPILFDNSDPGNTINIHASMSVEGWNLRMGLYNGANITLNNLQKLQDDEATWFTVDETSQLIIATMASDKLEGSDPLSLYSAREGGITWTPTVANTAIGTGTQRPIHYYLAGNGTVAYSGGISLSSDQVIKCADVTLSETADSRRLRYKTLVSFASSSTSTFTADATIKVKNADGSAFKEVNLDSVTATTPTLTASGNVGDCELVQTSTGVLLYYVDYAKTYKPSININFTHGGNALSTSDDVGLGDYAIPGTSWNNLAGSNGSLSALNAADSSGATFATAASVAISGTRGSWRCNNLTAASDLRHGYIDEEDGNPTPTVTVSGIPFEKYRVIVYTATDTPSTAFGYITINGKNYTYVNDALAEDTAAWGASGAQDTAEPMAEGVNVLVSAETIGSTLTVVGHRDGTARGCIAAIQIVEYVPEVTENDLVIPVMSASASYSVNEAKTLSGTVYVVGSGTLTLDGSEKITAATIDVAKDVVLNVNADRLEATTFTGLGTVVYNGSQPSTTKGFDNSSAWLGTVWVKNIGDTSRGEDTGSKVNTCLGSNTADASANDLNKWGNANSFVKFTNVRAYMAAANVPWTLILEDDSTNYAWYNNEGWTARSITIAGLKGDGTFWDINDGGCRPFLNFTDASQFTGSIKALGKQVFLNGAGSGNATSLQGGRIIVPADQTLTAAADKTWHTRNGLVVDGTLNVNGTLASESSSSAVSGIGTVVFTNRAPTPTGNAWWKNAAWTGTVEIRNHTLPDNWLLGDYGNTGSKVCLNGVTGPLKHGDANHNIKELIIASGGYTHTGKYSSGSVTFTIPCKVTGTGTYKMQSDGAASKTTYFTGDMSEFSGALAFGDNYSRYVIGATSRDFVVGSIVVGADKSFTVASDWSNVDLPGGVFVDQGGVFAIGSGGYVDPEGGLTIDGTATASGKVLAWGCIGPNAPVLINETGVLELTSTGNVNDSDFGTNPTNADYSKVTGTGTIKYSSTAGWRSFPNLDERMPATTLTIQIEIADSLILPSKPNGETIIGNLTGSKNIRSDFGSNGENGRILTVLESKDTEWQGKFVSNRITQFKVVAPAEGALGTLTLSGTQEATIPMQVDGSVNLTGTWVGATSVSGTFGGTGSIDGSLTFSDGATFMATNTPLKVSGDINVPATGVVTVDVSRVTFGEDKITILKNDYGFDHSKNFTLIGSVPVGYELKEQYGALVLTNSSGGDIPEPAGCQVAFCVTNVANAYVNVYTNGVSLNSVGVEDGFNIYYPNLGADATIVYSAQEGYVIIGPTRYSVTQVADNSAFPYDEADIAGMSVKSVDELTKVAFVTDSDGVNTLYETLNGAFEDVKSNETVTLIHDAELTNNVALDFPVVVAGYDCKMGGPLTLASGSSLTMESGVAITNDIVVTDCKVTVTYPTEADNAPTVTPPEGYDAVTTDNGDGTSTISFKVHEEPEPPTPSSGYGTWAEENGIEGDWDSATDGIANVFRYVFDKPSETFQLITNITFNADSHAVIWTPKMVNDTDTESAEFDIFVVPSDDLVFDENDETGKVSLSSNGETEIDEDLHEARFFRLKAEKKPQE